MPRKMIGTASHTYPDGSTRELDVFVVSPDDGDGFTFSPFVSIEDGLDSIIVDSAAHADALIAILQVCKTRDVWGAFHPVQLL